MSVRAIEAEVSIKSGVQAECTIGREVIVEVHDKVNLQPLEVLDNGVYEPDNDIDGYSKVVVNTPLDSLRSEIASAETASGCSPLTEGLTALTTYANEVTGQEDETLSDAVETLASGYHVADFNMIDYTSTLANAFKSIALPETLTLDFANNDNLLSMASAFRQCEGLKFLTIKNLKRNVALDLFIFGSSVVTLTFEGCDFKPTTLESFARATGNNLKAVYGEIDCSGTTSANATSFMFASSNNIEHFRFKKNSISTRLADLLPNSTKIEDDSYISLANALDTESPNQINLKTNNRAACNNITGNNVDGTFVADENGSMTLMDFITTVKGWTVT